MKVSKAIAKGLVFEQGLEKLGFESKSFEFKLDNTDKLIFVLKDNTEKGGIMFDCFGYVNESKLDWDSYRKEFKSLDDAKKEAIVKSNDNFITHYKDSVAVFHTKDLPIILAKNNVVPPKGMN